MKKVFALAIMIAVLCLAFVSCDGDSTEETDVSSTLGSTDVRSDNIEDGTFGVDFGELFGGSAIELPDDEL